MADTKLKTGTKIKATMPDSPEIGIDTDNKKQKNQEQSFLIFLSV